MKSSISFENTAIAFEHKSNKELNFSIFIFKIMNNARLVAFLTFLTKIALKIHLPISPLVKATIFKQFCGGTSINDCDSTIKQIGKAGIGAILDYSVEGAEEDDDMMFDLTRAINLKFNI
jgi:proline dehydrogenase